MDLTLFYDGIRKQTRTARVGASFCPVAPATGDRSLNVVAMAPPHSTIGFSAEIKATFAADPNSLRRS
jgi:hypothetical protein